jgi:hypothetical protein
MTDWNIENKMLNTFADDSNSMYLGSEQQIEDDKRRSRIMIWCVNGGSTRKNSCPDTTEVYETEVATNPMVAQGRRTKKIIKLSYVSSNIKKVGNENRHYVNISGSILRVKVTTKNMKDGDKVFWKVTDDVSNSKRNSPKPLVGTLVTEVKDNVAEIEFECGLAGGDIFTVEAGIKDTKYDVSSTSVNWRKIWYQLSHLQGMTIPDASTTIEAFKEGFVELIETERVTFTVKDFSSDSGIIYKRKHVMCNEEYFECDDVNPNDSIVLVNDENISNFDKLFKKHNDLHVHVVVCDEQYDYKEYYQENGCEYPHLRNDSHDCRGCANAKFNDCDDSIEVTDLGGFITLANNVIKDPLGGDIIVPASSGYVSKWGVYDNNGRKVNKDYFVKYMKDFIDGPYDGELASDSITVSDQRSDLKDAIVNLPDEAQKFLHVNDVLEKDIYVIKLSVKYIGISDPYLGGACKAPNIMVKYDSNDKANFNKTITHEIGHMFDLVPELKNEILGIEHSHQYYYLGSHCNNIIEPSTDYCVMKTNNDDNSDSNDKNKTDKISSKFCPECLIHFKSFDLLTMK